MQAIRRRPVGAIVVFLLAVATLLSISGARGADPTSPQAVEPKTIRELTALRTATADTYLQSDGSRLLKISLHPINYRVGDSWEPIDDRLTEGPDGDWHPSSSPMFVSLPSSLQTGGVSIGPPSQRLTYSLEGASASGAASGTRRTYLDAMPSVNVTYESSPQSIRETLTLTDASASTVYRYKLSLSQGMQASLTKGGNLVFKDQGGQVIYRIATPTVSDSSAKPGLPLTWPVHYELSPDGETLTMILDHKWLADPARVFPVKIDPDVFFGATQDCTIANQIYENLELCGEKLYVGVNSENAIGRALLHFDTSSIPRSSTILSSNLALWFESASSEAPMDIEAYGLEKSFNQYATWNSANGSTAWTKPGGDRLKPLAGSTNLLPEFLGYWIKVGFTPQVEQWIRDPSSNHGILLKSSNEIEHSLDIFIQSDNGEEAPEPDLEVVYEPKLGNPGGAQMYQQPIGNDGTLAVNVSNGNLRLTDPDIVYKGEGYSTELSRSFNNLDDKLAGSSFGSGWRLNMGEDELLYSAWWDGSNAFHQPDGSYTRFDRAPWADGSPSAGDLAFTGEADTPATLVVHENGTRTLTYNDSGTEWEFDKSENGFPQQVIDPTGEGNTISLTYTSSHLTKAKDTHGHEITLTRDPSTTHITVIKEGGETWKYGYDTSHRLISYEGPGGQEAKYGYTSEGLLANIVDPSGALVFTYGSQRVTSIRKLVNGTLTSPGTEDETTTFSYGEESTVVKHPDGSEETDYYDQFGDALEEPETQEAASEFYSGFAGIEGSAATADIDLQDHASVLDSQLTQQLAGNYVGEWFDPTSGRVQLGITSEGLEQTVEQDLDNLGLADNTDIVTESASVPQLKEEQGKLAEGLGVLIKEGLVALQLQPAADAVLVEKAKGLTTEQVKTVSEALASATVPISLVESEGTSVAEEPDACLIGKCDRPIRGGVSIDTINGALSRECTAGFLARSIFDDKPYIVTAGHCVADSGGTGVSWLSDSVEESPGPHEVGKAHSYVLGTASEVPGGTSSKGDMGLIAIDQAKFWGHPIEPIVIVYGNSETHTTRNERYGIIGTHYSPQTSRQEFVVCSGGYGEIKPGVSHQEEECGITEGYEREALYEEGTIVHNLERINACAAGLHERTLGKGASGSPVYKNHLAYGIFVANSPGKCKSSYEGINTIESVLHVHVLRGPAG
jgi:YD repeat-containing protein